MIAILQDLRVMQSLILLATGGHSSVDTAGTVHSASKNNCAVFVSLADLSI